MIKNEQHRCRRDHPPRDCRGGNGAPSSSDWWQKLQTLAFSLVTGPNSSDYQQEDVDRQIKRRNRTVVSIITLVFAIYLRRRATTNQHKRQVLAFLCYRHCSHRGRVYIIYPQRMAIEMLLTHHCLCYCRQPKLGV